MASALMLSACRRRRRAEFCCRRLLTLIIVTTDAAQRAMRGSLCAEAFTAIEADLEAFSPGRAAAHDGHGRLAEKASELFKYSWIMLSGLYCSLNGMTHT